MTAGDVIERSVARPVERPIIRIGGFDPSDISELKLWLDAADLSTLTLRSGVYVEEWRDKSGQENHFSQATEARQPSWGANEVNFAGSLVNLTAGSNYIFSENDGLSIVALAKSATPSGFGRFVFDFGLFNVAGYGLYFNQIRLEGYVPGFPDGGATTVGADYHRLMNVVEFGATQKQYLDNAEKFSDFISTPYLTAANVNASPAQFPGASGPMTVGKNSNRDDTQRSFLGKFKTLLIYAKKLDVQERAALDGYLAAIP